MDKTIFELTPVENVEKLPAGEYIVVNKNNFPFLTPYTDTDGWWQLDKPSMFTHYLRPFEERTFTLAEMKECWDACTIFMNDWIKTKGGWKDEPTAPNKKQYFKGKFNITLPE